MENRLRFNVAIILNGKISIRDKESKNGGDYVWRTMECQQDSGQNL